MNNTHRNSSPAVLNRVAAVLAAQGYQVGPVVITENPWTHGNPYFSTNAPLRAISDAHKAR